MAFNDDKVRTVEIDINLARPAAVFVLFDDRVSAPEWLRRDFVDTGWDVGMDEVREDGRLVRGVGPGDSIDHAFSVWRQDFREPCSVRLGTIRQEDTTVKPQAILESMYGVVVTDIFAVQDEKY